MNNATTKGPIMPPYATTEPVSPACVECAHCGCFVDTLMHTMKQDADGAYYCEECAADYLCSECDSYLGRSGGQTVDGKRLCDDCFDEEYTTCNDCGCTISKDDSTSSNCGDDYCSSCYSDRFSTCDYCGHEVENEDCHCTDNGNTYCDSCYDRYYTHCDDCGCELHTDDTRYNDNDDGPYCDSCYSDHESSTWEPGRAQSINSSDLVGSARCFGVEVETSRCNSHDDFRDVRAWGCKHDCSISGEEFFSAILQGNDGLAAIDELCEFAENHRWTVDNRCGLHVHLDMRNESLNSLKAIAGAFFITSEVWAGFAHADRKANRYCGPIRWNLNDLRGATGIIGVSSWERYQWLNLQAYPIHTTFEFRLHHGSIDGTEIKNWVRALAIFADWAKGRSLDDCITKFNGKTPGQQFSIFCEIWRNAGANDLVEWFTDVVKANNAFEIESGGDDGFKVSSYVESRINELVAARW